MIIPVPVVERELISRIRRFAGEPRTSGGVRKASSIVAGIGDDCAVLRVPPGHEALITTDFSLEGVHFRREWHSPQFIGHRCLTRGLSDIAAMGGEPIAAFLSLAVPARTPQKWVDGFFEGLLELAREFDVPLAGGDTTQSPDRILADIVVLGSVPKGEAILRSRARPGDRLYATGALGGAAAETDFLYSRASHARGKARSMKQTEALAPQPQLPIGRILREHKIATAMIDISDGLSTDLAHICEESGVGAEVDTESIPRSSAGRPAREVELEFALHGGEDYELLFTSPPNRLVPSRIAGVPITQIGHITRLRKIVMRKRSGVGYVLEPRGWEHFRR